MNNPLGAIATERRGALVTGCALVALAAVAVWAFQAGPGAAYLEATEGGQRVLRNGGYQPEGGPLAAYPPYVYGLFGPLASPAGQLLMVILNLAAPVVLVRALGGPPHLGLLAALTPQSVGGALLNGPEFLAWFGLALLAWLGRRGPGPWSGVAAAAALLMMTLKPNQLAVTPVVLAVRHRLATVVALAAAGLILWATTLVYGPWLEAWLAQLETASLERDSADSLMTTLLRLGVPEQGLILVQAGILLDGLRYLWQWRRHADLLPSWVVALAIGNALGVQNSMASAVPLLAATFCYLPPRWSVALVALSWAYAAGYAFVAGGFVPGYYGLVPLVCVVLMAVAARRKGVKL